MKPKEGGLIKSIRRLLGHKDNVDDRRPKRNDYDDDDGFSVPGHRLRRSERAYIRPKQCSINKQEINEHDFSNDTWYDHADTLARETSSDSISIKRVEKAELERLSTEPTVATAINTYCSTIQNILKPHLIRCSPECRQAIVTKLLYSPIFKDALDKWVRHLIIHGEAFAFPSPNIKQCKEWYAGDPRVYDFIKDGAGNKTSNGILPYGFEYIDYVADKKVANKKLLYDVDILYLSFNSNHYADRGFGYVELLSDVIYQKENINDAREERTAKSGLGIPVLTYGNDRFAPNAKQRIQGKQIVRDMFNTKSLGLLKPYTHDVKSLDEVLGLTKNDLNIQTEEQLDRLIAGMFGIPLVVLKMTAPNKEPAKIIEAMSTYLEWKIKYICDRLRLDEIFTIWANCNGFPDETVHVHWGNLTPESIKEATMRMYRLGKIGMLKPTSKLNSYVGTAMDFPWDMITDMDNDSKPDETEDEPDDGEGVSPADKASRNNETD